VKLAVASAIALTGCAELLGLDNTQLDYHDAATDGGVCDGSPACRFTSGRSVCGQLQKAGTAPGPLRAPVPSGMPCSGATAQGPCALAVYGDTLAHFLVGDTSSRVAGQVDDCGRYAVPDLPAGEADVVVVASGIGFADSARLWLNRATSAGTDDQVDAFAITPSAQGSWGTQLSASNPPDVSSGFAVAFAAGTAPVAMEQVQVNGQPAGSPPGTPWAAFFKDDGFATLDPALGTTAAPGTAFIVPRSGSFDLTGTHGGTSCTQSGLQALPNMLQFLVLTNC